jgi:ketosteroid isomerase-like protein
VYTSSIAVFETSPEIQMRTTREVLDHHLKCFAVCDLKGTLADYSVDAVFLGANGSVRGRDGIKAVFEKLFSEFAKPGASITSKQRLVEGDYVHLVAEALIVVE